MMILYKFAFKTIVPATVYNQSVCLSVADFIFGGSKITADGDCSHEIKWRLLLGRKVMTNLDEMKNSPSQNIMHEVDMSHLWMLPHHLWRTWDGSLQIV